jgi:O-antigen/teichoic acid export membrane protein
VVVGHALEVVLSYIMHPFRPRLDLSRFKELWGYSIWLLFAALGRYLEGRIDEVVVAGVATPADLGKYAVGTEVGQLPVTEVLDPVARALFPNYARLAGNLRELSHAYLQVLSGVTTIAVATSVGIALVAPYLVVVMLGQKWADVAPLVVWFAIAAGINGICNTVFPVLNAAGESRLSAIQTWMRVALYVPCMIWAAGAGSLIYFAMAKLAVAILLIPTFFIRLRQILPVTWLEIARAVWRPPVAAAVMAFAVEAFDKSVLTTEVPFLRLVACAVVGTAVFVATQLALWAMTGAPAGIERTLVRTARGALHV